MSKLVQETLLKPDLIKNIVPPLLNEIKAELISELKSAIRSTVSEAIEEAVVVSLGLQRLMSTDVYRRNLFPYCLMYYQ
jgi:hypothetical protein